MFKIKHLLIIFRNGNRYKKTGMIISLLMLVPILLVLTQSFKWYMLVDSPILQYMSFLILHGLVPYKDIFDFNLPGTYLMHIVAIKLFGLGNLGFRLFDLANLAVICWSLYLLLRKFGQFSVIISILLFVSIHLAGGQYSMGERDFLMIPYLGMATFFSYRAIVSSKIILFFPAGLLLGFCSTVKATPPLLAVFFILVFFFYHRRDWRKNIIAALWFLAGFIIFPVLIAGWLIKSGGWDPFTDIFLHFIPIHLSSLQRSPLFLAYVLARSPLNVIDLVIFISLVFFSLLHSRLTENKPKQVAYILLAGGIIFGLIHYWIQGKGWTYHLYPLFFFSITFCSLVTGDLFDTENILAKKVTLISVIILTCSTSFLTLKTFLHQPNLLNKYANGVDRLNTIVEKGVHDLGSLTKPGDKVQAFDSWSESTNILYRLKLYPPTRFIQEVNFTWTPIRSSPYLRRIWKEFMNGLMTRPPKCIIVFTSSGVLKNRVCNEAAFPGLCSFISRDYDLDIVRKEYKIYMRKK